MRLRSAEEPLPSGLKDSVELQVVGYETRELPEICVGTEPELALREVATLAEPNEENECGDEV